ncbi:hypothetical protein OSB04_008232 [Centaurea solstitialis]|uniref:Uncharacterized protein n=1 Tax=Centaurea solstitialis TaxID=347529 RepID=A0AA38WJA2_9ASTR|nr:hypothetical protein OSB04_008232 [Centaurea solstitialis]
MAACTNNNAIIITIGEADGAINQSSNRRSADYKPNIWNYDHLQFLGTEFELEVEVEVVADVNISSDDVGCGRWW